VVLQENMLKKGMASKGFYYTSDLIISNIWRTLNGG